MTDKIQEFIARYEANFGYFPTQKGGKGKDVMAVWRQWLIPITPEKIDKTFSVLESHREHIGRNFKPTLEEFKRAHKIAKGAAETSGRMQKKAQGMIDTPAFDFSKEGYPRVRELITSELPKKTRDRWKECWAMVMSQEITGAEFKAFQEKERWYLPEWEDYTEEEQRLLCRKWNVDMPEEEEIPF